MKGNDGSGNNSARDEWKTPQWFFDLINEQYQFEFDCCATGKNKKCEKYSNDFLRKRKISKMAWLNPPFSQSETMFSHFFNIVKKGVAIYRCDNLETKIWQNVILKHGDWIFIPNKRISYEGEVGSGSRFPSALIGVNCDPPRNLKGRILLVSGKIYKEHLLRIHHKKVD